MSWNTVSTKKETLKQSKDSNVLHNFFMVKNFFVMKREFNAFND